jgi:hypothetical protein
MHPKTCPISSTLTGFSAVSMCAACIQELAGSLVEDSGVPDVTVNGRLQARQK